MVKGSRKAADNETAVNGNRTPAEMFGEFLRDASVLLLVFGIVLYGKPLTDWWSLSIVFLVIGFLVAGMLIEVLRK